MRRVREGRWVVCGAVIGRVFGSDCHSFTALVARRGSRIDGVAGGRQATYVSAEKDRREEMDVLLLHTDEAREMILICAFMDGVIAGFGGTVSRSGKQ